jgi:hypothetical protein
MTEQPEQTPEPTEEVQPTPEVAEAPPESSIGSGIQIEDAPAVQEPTVSQERLGALAQEVIQNGGKLTEQHYSELSEAGFGDKAMVDQFFAGQMALREQQRSHVFGQLGGEEKVNAAMDWAAKNLPQDKIDSLNADLATASLDGQARILGSLIQQAGGVTSALKASPGGSSSPAPYNSLSEFYADVAKPEYRKDKAFAAKCQARLVASNVRVPTKRK